MSTNSIDLVSAMDDDVCPVNLQVDSEDEVIGETWHVLAPPFCSGNDVLHVNRNPPEGLHISGSSPAQFNRFNQLPVLSEDLRISKILRRLMIETNRKTSVELCRKLDAAVRNQANATYICRSFDILFDNMITVLRQCPPECLESASAILGVMGYINRYDFVAYQNNLKNWYTNNKTLRQYLMMALRTTISCDAVNLDLKAYIDRLLSVLKEYLENAEVAENFIAISETISEISKHYKQSFLRHFTDIVDIIIGWHIEIDQPAALKRHCGKILQQFSEYFLGELDFTLGLLGQFIEDIEACGEEIIVDDSSIKSKQQTEARVGAFIGAFTSIIKAMVSKGVFLNNYTAPASIVQDAKRVVNNVTKQCFKFVPLLGDETVINLNEFYCVVTYDKSVENLCDLESIIELQLNHLSGFNENQVTSFLYMILHIVRQYRTQLPLSFVSLVMNKENTCLQELKLNCGLKSYKLFLKIYHEILIIKNVPLLQEAYRHILKDINETIAYVRNTEYSTHSMSRCELVLSFYLAALSAMACQTSSIIGMYALNPSILELLITNCQAANESLWRKYPTLHKALLSLIKEHSSKNYNFRQSSKLLVHNQDSPTSENFSTILKFLSAVLRWYVSQDILNWIEQLLVECKDDFELLTQEEDFLEICCNITLLAKHHPHLCSRVLRSILKYPKIPDYILCNIKDIVLHAFEGTNTQLLPAYAELLALVPLEISLSGDNENNMFNEDKLRLAELQYWHKSTVYHNSLRPKYFKTFIESLEPNSKLYADDTLYQAFIEKSFVHLHREHLNDYLETLQCNKRLMQFHVQYEAARYCVQQKLRTTLGKPQETFLAIEAIIMKYARYLAEKGTIAKEGVSDFNDVLKMQVRCRTLLGFLENLEKHIYNAAEGTAFAMLPAEKPAKTFFRVNASTCNEWFKRIRTAVNLIGIHCMEPEMVIRYSESILQSDTVFSNRGLLDRTITSMAWALFTCGEAETLYGLQSWLKLKNCKSYEWIQHVAEHASGHFEKAACGYEEILGDDNINSMDLFTKEFLQQQLIECMCHTVRWPEIKTIGFNTTFSQRYLECLETIYDSAMKISNKETIQAVLKMTEWSQESNRNKRLDNVQTFSCYDTLSALKESCLLQGVTNMKADTPFVENSKVYIRQGMHEYILCSNENLFNELILLNHVTHNLQHGAYGTRIHENTIAPVSLNSILLWTLISENKSKTNHHVPLLLTMATAARNQNNLSYSQHLLEHFFRLKGFEKSFTQLVNELKLNEFDMDCSDLVIVKGAEELVKCIYATNNSSIDAIEVASSFCIQLIEKNRNGSENNTMPNTALNFLLTMSDSLVTNRSSIYINNISQCQQFEQLQSLLPNISFCPYSDSNNKSFALPPIEYAVGKLLNASILCDENSGDAWFSFGNWCYRWGKKLMESSSEQPDGKEVAMSNRNIASVQEILGSKFDDTLTVQVVNLLNKHMVNAIKDDNVDDNEYSHNAREALENELKKIGNISSEQLNSIISVWCQAHKGVYGFYEQATIAYFRYLAIESGVVSTKKFTSNTEIENTFVALRLLRLIVKHATGLQDALEEGLRNTPLKPWKVIIPQLFSRLNHHESYVRRSVSDLLCRLSINQPQLIIFPAVVGAQQELKHCDTAESQKQLSNCFLTLLNSISSQSPDMVLQVQMLVCELRRITLLWEEHWIHSLAQLYSEYSHLLNALEAESKKALNKDVILVKYDIFRQHLSNDFEKIASVTEKDPETSYERNFQERFRPHIEAVRNELQRPIDPMKPSDYWPKIKQLYTIFQQRPLRGSSSTIRIADVSPVLANMKNTTISMPGVDTYGKTAVYIKSVESTIYILPTKTKPKKLSLCGSNGQNYTYLFKGQEDLHLDERIMQFLAISNSMMSRSYGSKSKTDCFKAHHYSVIPLGPRSGLISWVDNCTALFAIYKKWQQREAFLKQQQKERQPSKQYEQDVDIPAITATSRPSELFYNKLTPLLAERNLKVSDPRKQWPIAILKRVLRELSSETPGDLLAKEIWCFSTNSMEWRKSVRRYTMSMAVMSIIGYVIGLGDRHLDNILIKLGTGEIVHIDYNVCFEKGKSLRVPEKVPFRMSQNLKCALGLVGTEGSYRMACSHVLKVLRKERETLLTLLEAFVYDPLVDWTLSDDGNATHSTSASTAAIMITSLELPREYHLSPRNALKSNNKLDVDLTRQTLTIKINDIKPIWLQYKCDLATFLQMVKDHLQKIIATRQNIVQCEEERDNFTKQLAMIRELEALGSARGSHALNTVTQRYKAYKRDLNSFEKIKSLVEQTIKDLDIVLTTYFEILLRPNEIKKIEINNNIDPSPINECSIFKDLLMSENDYYKSLEYDKNELNNSFIQIQGSATECRDLILFYSRVLRFHPRSQLQQNHLMKYKKAFTDLVGMPHDGKYSESSSSTHHEIHDFTLCQNYFEKIVFLYNDLQTQMVQSQLILQERQQEQVRDKDAIWLSIKELNLNNDHYGQHVRKFLLNRIEMVHKSFVLKETELFSSKDYLLLSHQISFLSLIEKLMNTLCPIQTSELLSTLLQTFIGLRNLMSSLENVCESLLAYMLNSSTPILQEFDARLYLKSNTEINVIFEETDNIFEDTVLILEKLKDNFIHANETNPSESIQLTLTQWNINIKEYIKSIRTETVLALISEVKCSILAVRNIDVDNIVDLHQLRRPINDLIMNLQSKLFSGLISYALMLLHDSISQSMKADVLRNDNNDCDKVNDLLENLFMVLEHENRLILDEELVMYFSKMKDQYHVFATSYYWLHAHHFPDNRNTPANLKSKKEILSNLHSVSQVLSTWKSTTIKIQAVIEVHRSALKQLLSCCSMLPSSDDFHKLNEAIAAANQNYRFFVSLATSLMEYSAVILQFEISDGDEPFDSLIKQFNEEKHKLQNCEISISSVERSLVQLLDPEDNIDNYWIANISDLLDEMIFTVQKKICDFERAEATMQDTLQEYGHKLQMLIDSPIRGDLRQLLRIFTKSHKLSKADNGDLFQAIRDIQNTVKILQNKLSELQIQLLSGEFEASILVLLHSKVDELYSLCNNNNYTFNSLIDRMNKLYCDDGQYSTESQTKNFVSREAGGINSQIGEQKRNAYAVSVWKRIRMKLEGRDPDPNRRSSVAEQVEYVIAEATSEDNLASLYEGWTPWV
ncbi:serine/threonine-protein kinase Smg1 [Haematobia irritans]|uniref:serine/threonine-protein kinase Smg1 n=1 Tax=Haematobia irritans TaxID=7368 RepID=UPI003F4FFB27